MFKSIHDIIYHGGGGFDYYTLYNMPIWLRKFTYQQLTSQKQQERDEIEKVSSNKNSTSTKIGDSKIPQHMKEALTKAPRKPSYKTKASKK